MLMYSGKLAGMCFREHILLPSPPLMVSRSYSWSANIAGSKEWLLLPPKQEDQLRDKLGNLPFDLTCDDVQEKIKCGQATPPIRIVQGRGEIIFVPR
jgi:hypothetical protein